MAYKQKKMPRDTRNRYLRPGALARLRDSRSTTRPCKAVVAKRNKKGRKGVKVHDLPDQSSSLVSISSPITSPIRTDLKQWVGPFDANKHHGLLGTPKTQIVFRNWQSRLESLPLDLLVKIMCHLHHDQLKAVFHVSQRIREAVLIARDLYFNYTTPDRSRQEMLRTKTPLPRDRWPFISNKSSILRLNPQTPRAPRHGPRPPRNSHLDMKQIAAVLFPDSALPPPPSRCSCSHPSTAATTMATSDVFRSMASNRVLYYEDDLCHAVAQNKLC